MNILAWSENTTTPAMLVGGWLKEEKNWQSTDMARDEQGLRVENGQDRAAPTHTNTSINEPALT
jgi:hypothetical protein